MMVQLMQKMNTCIQGGSRDSAFTGDEFVGYR